MKTEMESAEIICLIIAGIVLLISILMVATGCTPASMPTGGEIVRTPIGDKQMCEREPESALCKP